MNKQTTIFLLLGALMVLFSTAVSATLQLDRLQFDPAIIASGDEVDIVVQFHEDSGYSNIAKYNSPDYTFQVMLEADDDLTKDYITIQDSLGNQLAGTIYPNGQYNQVFRVKVKNNAPAGNYEFKLVGKWFYKGTAQESTDFMRFQMLVKKEGIVLNVNSFETLPAQVHSGDDFVEIIAHVENTGEKDAKNIQIKLKENSFLEPSYTNNNLIQVGQLKAGESKDIHFYVDVNETATPGVLDLDYFFQYQDEDNNNYVKSGTLPFLIKSHPYLIVSSYEGAGKAGSSSELKVYIKNTGSESAEAVDVRLIKQNSQPFDFDVRSDYIGELEPGEEGLAIFEIGVASSASIKEHDFKVFIRAKGDSDAGDDNIYTYNRRAKFKVTGKKINFLLIIGLLAAAGISYYYLSKKKILKRLRK